MAETKVAVPLKTISYKGVFSAKGLFEVIQSWCSDKGYYMFKKSQTEALKKEGKNIEFTGEFMSTFTDYAKSIIWYKINFSKLKDITITRDGKKVKLQEGEVDIKLIGKLVTDYEGRWETKPLFYFLRILFGKYLYAPYISRWEKKITQDVETLKDYIESYLNMERFLK
ncbi:hypothetical protein D6825_03625 [Candidatus Woesearchaeota archaeon]|nr:MAG: hypothetical protein D6825_03625 [Candidatus Woesearchaeota archaeon]